MDCKIELKVGLMGVFFDEVVIVSIGGVEVLGGDVWIDDNVIVIFEVGYFFCLDILVWLGFGFFVIISFYGVGLFEVFGYLGDVIYGVLSLILCYYFNIDGRVLFYIGVGVVYGLIFDEEDVVFVDVLVDNG